MKAHWATTFAVSVAAVGCGGGTPPTSTGSVVISGLPTGTVDTTSGPIIGTYTASTSQLALAISATVPPPAGNTVGVLLSIDLNLAGTSLEVGNYANASSNVTQGSATVSQVTTWAAYDNTPGKTDQGSFSLSITSTGSSQTTSSGVSWTTSHGRFDLLLPPSPGNSSVNNVAVLVTF